MVGVSQFPITTPNSTTPKPYKHLRIAKPVNGSADSTMAKAFVFGCGRFRTFCPGFGFGQRCHLDRHGQLALKQLRSSVLNEMHTNSYTGPRLAHAVQHNTTNKCKM